MAVTGGFFNSLDNDRLYYADQVNSFFEGLVSPGVFESVDGALQVKAASGMNIQVEAGRLTDSKGRWLRNYAVLDLTIDSADVLLPRYDAVIAAIDSSMEKRAPEIYIKKGIPAGPPVKPSVIRNSYLEEYCLAYVYVDARASTITQSAITDTRPDNNLCGFVTGLIEQLNTTDLFIQFQTAFDEWFQTIKDTVKPFTLIRTYNSVYTTTEESETIIPINISQFNKELDILQVYINGLRLIPDLEYTLDSDEQITLAKDVRAGTSVFFEIFKSEDEQQNHSLTSGAYTMLTDKRSMTVDMSTNVGNAIIMEEME